MKNQTDSGRRQQLLDRIDKIALSLETSDQALALIGLGSAGRASHRIDAYSDLDLFVIVEEDNRSFLLDNLDWLTSVCPLVYSFNNSDHGYKVLFEDGIFCEFALLLPAELENIPYADARVIWAVDPTFAISLPSNNKLPEVARHEIEWYVGEALTNLYVGLGRYRRGEKLNASRFIQGYAMDHIIELSDFIEEEYRPGRDPFSKTRRYEQRYPKLAQELPNLKQGYERSVESALAMLDFLERHFKVNKSMREAIVSLAEEPNDR